MTLLFVSNGLSAPVVILLILLALPLYFLPAIAGRHKKARGKIFLLNLFLGWTFVVWIVLLAWAVSD